MSGDHGVPAKPTQERSIEKDNVTTHHLLMVEQNVLDLLVRKHHVIQVISCKYQSSDAGGTGAQPDKLKPK